MKLRLAQEKYQSTQELDDSVKNQKQKIKAKKNYDDRVILNKRKLQEVKFKQRKKSKIEKETKPCDLTNERMYMHSVYGLHLCTFFSIVCSRFHNV